MSDQQQQDSSRAAGACQINVQELKSQIANKFQANRPLVLKLHSILTWEQDMHPIVLVALVTISFLIIHLLNSSLLTTFSYLGMLAALIDLAIPTIAKTLCGSSSLQAKLSDKDNQRFDKICMDMAKVCAFSRSICDHCCLLKNSKPKLYYPGLLGALIFLAYIGNKINNLFLTYLVTLLVVLYPGLDKRGIPQKAVEFVFAKLGRRPPAFLTCSSSSSASSSGSASDRRGSGKRN